MPSGFASAQTFAPPFNYRLRNPGLMKVTPAFVELGDDEIDLDFHFRHNALPKPSGERELGKLASRFHSRPLHMSKPLWELHLIEGLDRDRFAIYFKVHHALFDGIGASRRFLRMLSTDAGDEEVRPIWTIGPTRRAARDERGSGEDSKPGRLGALKQSAADALTLGKLGGGMIKDAVRPSDPTRAAPWQAPKTRLNQKVGQQRRLATQVLDFDRLRGVTDRAGVTINDVFLAISAGGLRRYLLELGDLPESSLIAGAPVSLRVGSGDNANNAFTVALIKLGTEIADPAERLREINRSSTLAKDVLARTSKGVAENYAVLFSVPFMAQGLIPGVRGRGRPPYNLIVSNVPGAPETHYLAGAELEAVSPFALLMHGAALFIASYTIGGKMCLGFVGDRDRLPHLQNIAVYTGEALGELEEALAGATPQPRKRATGVPKS